MKLMEELYKISIENLYQKFSTSKNGLTEAEAQKRLTEYGKNQIEKKKKFNIIKIFFSQFNSFLIYILIFAAAMSFFIQHYVDGFVISGIIILNGTIGFIQQYKAEKTIENLKKLINPKSRVVRDGKQIEILSTDLVIGDIVIFEAGNKIPADLRIIESENLKVNEAILTGESFAVSKDSSEIKNKVGTTEQKNMLFAGTNIVRGTALGLVITTGMNTFFGDIANKVQDIEEVKTPMQKRLDTFSKQIGLIILAMVSIIIPLGFTDKLDLGEMFLTAVALAVSAIPEGLPAVLVITFAIASLAMSKNNVVIRRLPAVESLGSVTVICSDKTGTLTEEKMTIQEMICGVTSYAPKSTMDAELELLIKTSVLCNNAHYEKTEEGYSFIGDPTETALVRNAINFKIDKKVLIENEPSIQKIEFNSVRKMMSVLRNSGEVNTLYSKGAIKKILKISHYELINGQIRKLSLKRKLEILLSANKMEEQALRVLGFGFRKFEKKDKVMEDGLIFLGLMGMLDPPRIEVKAAIKECSSAGIKVKIITGDSEITAKAIAEKVGIVGRVVNEQELLNMSDLELEKQIDEIVIFARMTPKQKLRITQILQKKGEIVAITGDGVNDVLALKSADVGIAMGKRGSDVARGVADIILLDDNFASIVSGIKEGRRTYDNIKKFTKYLLAVNFSAIFLIIFTLLLGMPLPLIPLQILWMNIISDSFPSLMLAFEKEENVMKRKPKIEKSILSGTWKFIIYAGILAFIIELAVYLIGINNGFHIDKVRTLVLTTAIIYELLFVYTCRSSLSLKEIGIFSNKWLNYAVFGSILVHLALLYTNLGSFFSVVPLTINDWLFVLPFAFSGVIVFEVVKLVRKKT